MRYFKCVDDNGNVIRIDSCNTNVSNGIEITEDEYNIILSEIRPLEIRPPENSETNPEFSGDLNDFDIIID